MLFTPVAKMLPSHRGTSGMPALHRSTVLWQRMISLSTLAGLGGDRRRVGKHRWGPIPDEMGERREQWTPMRGLEFVVSWNNLHEPSHGGGSRPGPSAARHDAGEGALRGPRPGPPWADLAVGRNPKDRGGGESSRAVAEKGAGSLRSGTVQPWMTAVPSPLETADFHSHSMPFLALLTPTRLASIASDPLHSMGRLVPRVFPGADAGREQAREGFPRMLSAVAPAEAGIPSSSLLLESRLRGDGGEGANTLFRDGRRGALGMPIVGEERVPADHSWRFPESRSVGASLGIVSRVFLEKRFPREHLESVRIHTDAPADRAARILGADAFSLGRDIFFRTGRFDLATPKGMALLGHELVHVRQAAEARHGHAESSREALEREALGTESLLLRSFPLVGVQRDEQAATPLARLGRHYEPMSLEHSRPSVAPAMAGGAGPSPMVDRSFPSVGASMGGGTQPLKAEEGRAVNPASASSASPAAPVSGDADGLARQVIRSLKQKIWIEQERRGVDRWGN